MKTADSSRACITAIGAVTPLGETLGEVAEALYNSRSGIKNIEKFDVSSFSTKWAGIPDFGNQRIKWPRTSAASFDRPGELIYAERAVELLAAEFDPRTCYKPERIGCSLGVDEPAIDIQRCVEFLKTSKPSISDKIDIIQKAASYFRLSELVNLEATSVLRAIHQRIQFAAYTRCHVGLCSASLQAMGMALRALRNGEADAIITGGVSAKVTPVQISRLEGVNAVCTDPKLQGPERSRPFDGRRSGFVPGEGAVLFLLERESAARARGGRIYGRLAEYAGWPVTTTDFADYSEFKSNIPACRSVSYADLANRAIANSASQRFYIGCSSATSGTQKLVLRRAKIKTGEHGISDVDLVDRLRRSRILKSGDIVANCFAADNFSLLHHAICALLEALDCHIVPVSVLCKDRQGVAQLAVLAKLTVNVLVGTPSTLVQLANLVRTAHLSPPVESIIFTGEPVGLTKRRHLQSAFPNAQLHGLYGLSECGFVGISEEDVEHYVVRDNVFFAEVAEDGELLLTCMDEKVPVPILRYATGDRANLGLGENHFVLSNIHRIGPDFKYMGNIVSYSAVKKAVAQAAGHEDFSLQIELTTDNAALDALSLTIISDRSQGLSTAAIESSLRQLPELDEAYQRGAGRITITFAAPTQTLPMRSGKEILVLDHRTTRGLF